MTKEIKARQTVEQSRQETDITGGASRNDGTESSGPSFNRYIYENLQCQVESQIEHWNRMAVRESNSEAVHALRQKAEGLGYALRLLYPFKSEFEELVASAARLKCAGCGAELDKPSCQAITDSDLCSSCYEIGRGDETFTGDNGRGTASPNDFAATLPERNAE